MNTNFRADSDQHPRAGPGTLGPAVILVAVAAVAWALAARRMEGMDMGPGTDLGGLAWFAGLWVTMMAAMMLPSAIPMVLTYARASRRAPQASRTAATCVFACGYLFSWLAVGLLAYALIAGVRSLHPAWLAWDRGGPYAARGVILAAALYELTPAKSACLRHCRDPELLTSRWRPGLGGALMMGIEHGGFCVGSSWALMAALFALGVMSVTWMIVVTALVAIEKLLPWGALAVRTTALFVAALGLAVALAPTQVPGLTIPH